MFNTGILAALGSAMTVVVVVSGTSDDKRELGAKSEAQTQAKSQKMSEADADAAADEFLVQTPASADEIREYYKGVEPEGLELVSSVLVVTQQGTSASRPYQLTEWRKGFSKGIETTRTTRSRGNLTIVPVPQRKTTSYYRLDGGASPKDAKVFLKLPDSLRQLKDPAVPGSWTDSVSLDYAAKSANGRVELYAGLDLPRPRVQLRVGDVLVVQIRGNMTLRLENPSPPLRQESANKDGDYQLVTLRAVKSGSTDVLTVYLDINKQRSQVITARVKVD